MQGVLTVSKNPLYKVGGRLDEICEMAEMPSVLFHWALFQNAVLLNAVRRTSRTNAPILLFIVIIISEALFTVYQPIFISNMNETKEFPYALNSVPCCTAQNPPSCSASPTLF